MAPRQRNIIALLALAACLATCVVAVIMLRSVASTSTDRVVLVTDGAATRPTAKAAKRTKKTATPKALVGGRPAVSLMFVTLRIVEEQRPVWSGNFAPANGPWLARASKDSAVRAWLVDWQQKTSQGATVTAEDRAKLNAALQTTPLDYLALVGLGKTIEFYTKDQPTAGMFYAAAVRVGDKGLQGLEPGSVKALQVVVALSGGKGVLWDLIDGGESELLGSMTVLNNDLVGWIPADDRTLSNFRLHGQIGVAECLYAHGKTQDAVADAMAINVNGLDDSDRVHVAWIRGISFYFTGRYNQSIPELEIAAGDKTFKYSRDAWTMVIKALCEAHRADDAQTEYRRYAANFRPDFDEAMDLTTAIEKAKFEQK